MMAADFPIAERTACRWTGGCSSSIRGSGPGASRNRWGRGAQISGQMALDLGLILPPRCVSCLPDIHPGLHAGRSDPWAQSRSVGVVLRPY